MKYQIIYANPSSEIIRQCIEQQYCWICGKDGWKALSQHLVKKHGLPAVEVREMAYMFKRECLISKELSEAMGKAALAKFGDKLKRWEKGEAKPNRSYSTKAKDILRKRVKEILPLSVIGQRKKRKPHCCQVCGKIIETSKPQYCPECWRIAIGRATKKHLTPERIAHFKSVRYKATSEEQSLRAKAYWERIKSWPIEKQREYNLKRAESRRVRVIKQCVICGKDFSVIPSHAGESVTCGKQECKRENQSRKSKGRRHTPESIAKMSAYAKERHIREPLFGRMKARQKSKSIP